MFVKSPEEFSDTDSYQITDTDSSAMLSVHANHSIFKNSSDANITKAITKPSASKYFGTKSLTKQAEEKRTYFQHEEKPQNPSNSFPKQEKLKEGERIDLNTADSLMLCKVPGVGAAYAKRIIGYRNLLGGYYSPEQLQEVYGMYVELYEKIISYFYVSDSLRTLSVNASSLDKLRAHPYINFYQAKAIVESRRKKGNLKSINDLILLEEFSEEDRARLLPYLDF